MPLGIIFCVFTLVCFAWCIDHAFLSFFIQDLRLNNHRTKKGGRKRKKSGVERKRNGAFLTFKKRNDEWRAKNVARVN